MLHLAKQENFQNFKINQRAESVYGSRQNEPIFKSQFQMKLTPNRHTLLGQDFISLKRMKRLFQKRKHSAVPMN